jgi:hypothetical protein
VDRHDRTERRCAVKYQVITVKAMQGLQTDFEWATQELSRVVNEAIQEGWEPQGGIAVGRTRVAEAPYLFQAAIKRD